MKYKRKTMDIWQLVTDYGYGQEVECEYDNFAEALADKKVYIKENVLGFLPNLISIKIRKRRKYV